MPSGPQPGLAHYSSQILAPERGQRWGGWKNRLRNMVFLAEDKGGLRGNFWPDRHGLQVQGTMCCLDHLRQAPNLRDTSASPFVYRGCPPRDCDNLILSTHASPDIRHVHRHFPNNILTLSPRGGLCAPFQGLYRKPRLRDVKVLVQHHTPRTLLRQSCSKAISSNTGLTATHRGAGKITSTHTATTTITRIV